MPVTVAVLLMVAGVLLAAAALVVALWAWVDRPLRVPARGGVVGREGRGVLVRDGDGLVFVRRMRRFVVPLAPGPERAVRRYLTGGPGSRRSGSQEVVAGVLRRPDHVVHTVAVVDPRDAARLTAAAAGRRRLTSLSLVPRFAAAVLAVGVVLTLPWLAVWVSGTSVDGAILLVDRRVVTFGLIGVGSVLGLSLLVARGVLTVCRRPVTLWPMTASVPGFDGSAPDEERYRARRLPLHDLARAVQLSERHGDVEDNDLFRSRGRAIWTLVRGPVGCGVLMVPFSALYLAAIMQSVEYGVLTAALVLLLVVGLLVRRGRQARVWSNEAGGWSAWDRAAAWRRRDGETLAVLFDGTGAAVWWVPVDRVFAPDAHVEVNGLADRSKAPALRANGVDLFALRPAERVSAAAAAAMRQDLVRALTDPKPPAWAPLR